MAENLYLLQAQTGKNRWWRYLLGILALLVFWQVGAGILIIPILIQNQGNLPEEPTPISFALLLLGFGYLLLGTWAVNRVLHGRSVVSLTTGLDRVSWKRIFFAAAIWMVVMSLVAVVEAMLFPGRALFSPGAGLDPHPNQRRRILLSRLFASGKRLVVPQSARPCPAEWHPVCPAPSFQS